jgi:PRTRC genetic system protein C
MTDQNPNPSSRVFKIGATRIVEDPSMAALTNEQVRDLLKTSYPEIANATLREREENGLRVVEFLPQPGRKG